jgi:hypothetical protein
MRVSSRKKKEKRLVQRLSTCYSQLGWAQFGLFSPLFFLLVLPTWSLDLGSWILGLVSRDLDSRLHVVISSLSRSFLPSPPHCFSHCSSPPHLVASHDLPPTSPSCFQNLHQVIRTSRLSSEVIPSGISNPYPDHRVLPRNQIARSQSSPVDRYRVPKVPRVCRPRVRLLHLQPPAPCSLFTIYYFRSLPPLRCAAPPLPLKGCDPPEFAISTFGS